MDPKAMLFIALGHQAVGAGMATSFIATWVMPGDQSGMSWLGVGIAALGLLLVLVGLTIKRNS